MLGTDSRESSVLEDINSAVKKRLPYAFVLKPSRKRNYSFSWRRNKARDVNQSGQDSNELEELSGKLQIVVDAFMVCISFTLFVAILK
jgi:hypothetical protein